MRCSTVEQRLLAAGSNRCSRATSTPECRIGCTSARSPEGGSPAGQAAWIYEKFQSKTDNRGLAEDAIPVDDMLDTISLYWFTNTAASSARIY